MHEMARSLPGLGWSLLGASLVLLSCGGRYDVGDKGDGGTGGMEAGAGGSDANGGSKATGGGAGNAAGGSGGETAGSSGETGGRGGTSSSTGGSGIGGGTGGDTGGTGTSGSAGAPMTGGAAGMPTPTTCGVEQASLEYGELAAPDEVYRRISRLLYDEERDPPADLPEVTTPELASTLLVNELEAIRSVSTPPDGLARFMQGYLAAEGEDPALGERWGRLLAEENSMLWSLFTSPASEPDEFGLFSDVARLRPGISGRGTVLSNSLFCTGVPAPPVNIAPIVPGPDQTRREALEEDVASPTCAGCHALTDPLGYALEILAPETAELRSTDNGQPIDASGRYSSVGGSYFVFQDIRQLSGELSTSCEVGACFASQLFSYALAAGNGGDYGQEELDQVLFAFGSGNAFRLESLLLAIVESPSFLR